MRSTFDRQSRWVIRYDAFNKPSYMLWKALQKWAGHIFKSNVKKYVKFQSLNLFNLEIIFLRILYERHLIGLNSKTFISYFNLIPSPNRSYDQDWCWWHRDIAHSKWPKGHVCHQHHKFAINISYFVSNIHH